MMMMMIMIDYDDDDDLLWFFFQYHIMPDVLEKGKKNPDGCNSTEA